MSKRSGHTLVEFVLIFPFFVFLCVALFQLALLAIQQWSWQRLCFRTARILALSQRPTQADLILEAKRLLSPYEPLSISVRLLEVPSKPIESIYRATKRVELIDVTIEKDRFPFTMHSHARDVRVRAIEGN